LAALEEMLRERICSVCVDRNVDGTCNLSRQHECALFESFPKIVQAVSRVNSDKIDDYVTAIREDVCAGCVNQDADGLCKLRDEVRCVLDRYLLLIVGMIEEARGVTLKQGKILNPI
ncbi:MAG: hypothetical protein HY648_10665, partial [Acidobacteria bacterium]|nr:hypothetical protein [Acidobacteriota bacterium]